MRQVLFFDLITRGNLAHSMEGVVKFILKVPAWIYSSFNVKICKTKVLNVLYMLITVTCTDIGTWNFSQVMFLFFSMLDEVLFCGCSVF